MLKISFSEISIGELRLLNFIIDRFNLELVITATAKTALLSSLISRQEFVTLPKFENPKQVADMMITDRKFEELNKLKKSNPEAFFYWFNSLDAKKRD